MFATSSFGDLPGLLAPVETYEGAWSWGPAGGLTFTNGWIASTAADVGNSPTWELRAGLLVGQQTATGQWTNYAATNTDGSQIAAGVIVQALRMQDVFTGVNTQKFYAIVVAGRLQAAKILGLDNYARQCMSSFFLFDDDFPGRHWFDWKLFQSKTANYQIVAADNLTLFDNTGALGAVTLTLPPIVNGFMVGIYGIANQNFAITSSEGGNIVAQNNLVANTLTLQTASQIIGGGVKVFSNPGATKWISVNISSGTQAITAS